MAELARTLAAASSSADLPWDLAQPARIPVARPRLAPVEAALPYLRRIDEAQLYSNFGPLNAELEARLAARFGLAAGCVVTCANATLGLTLALQRAAAAGGTCCLMPAWTFAATAHAALAAGLTPVLADVDPATGALTPDLAQAAAEHATGPVAAVVPVAPFGLPLDLAAWAEFERRTGIAVVLDAAAGFDALRPAALAAVVSLHATKILGIGEGGFIVSRDQEAIVDLRRRSNFGFNGRRDAELAGANGKISEYAAAFGLAALDLWPARRAQHQAVLGYYRAGLADAPGLSFAPGLGEAWVCSTCNIEAEAEAVLEIEAELAAAGIATRRWWGRGLQGHQAFARLPRAPLPITEALAARTLGLPCWPEAPRAALDEVIAIVRRVLGAC